MLAAYVRAQRGPVMKLRLDSSAMADLQRIFISLVGTLEAAPLLEAARRLREREGAAEAIRKELAVAG